MWIALCRVASVPLLDSVLVFFSLPRFKIVNKLNRRTESMAIRCIPLCIMNRAHDLQSLVCLCTHTPYTMDWLTLKNSRNERTRKKRHKTVNLNGFKHRCKMNEERSIALNVHCTRPPFPTVHSKTTEMPGKM